jgi:eukaryotic-like serine/threonine-protein kinase
MNLREASPGSKRDEPFAGRERTPSGTLVCPVSTLRPKRSSRAGEREPLEDGCGESPGRELPSYAVLRRRASARLGSTLNGRYRLDQVLGVGGMSTVYAATHLRIGVGVAIKLMHPEVTEDLELLGGFVREARITDDVDHAGTARVLDDDWSAEGLPYLVMEKLEGETLAQRMARPPRPLPVAQVVRIMTAVLDVLAAAHRQGTVHCDIKPENVFLATDGTIKLLDFGIACALPDSETSARRRPPPPAATGVCGTPAYMPPERARSDRARPDVRSDIWSVGALAFVLLSGRHVHESRTPQEMMLRAATEPAPPISVAAPGVPCGIASVIDRALAFRLAERWSSATAMRAALRSTTCRKVRA